VEAHLFAEAEELAREMDLTRSGLYTLALEELLKRLRAQRVTEALDRVYRAGPTEEERSALDAEWEHHRQLAQGDCTIESGHCHGNGWKTSCTASGW